MNSFIKLNFVCVCVTAVYMLCSFLIPDKMFKLVSCKLNKFLEEKKYCLVPSHPVISISMRMLLRLLRNIHFWFISITKPLARVWWGEKSAFPHILNSHQLQSRVMAYQQSEFRGPSCALQTCPSPATVRCYQVFLLGLLEWSTFWSSYWRLHVRRGPCKTCHQLAWNLPKQEIPIGTRIWGFYAQKSHERLLNALLKSRDTIWFCPELSVL